ncbi:AAA family ATPase [Sphingobacterium kyonggiense]
MIERINFRNKTFEFIKHNEYLYGENVFTIIVGKNGTGKSTLLSSIVSELMEKYNDRFYNDNELGFSRNSYNNLVIDNKSDNVIAVSSSPFDKFPLTRKFNDIESYTYLGLRDLSSINFGLSYMSKIISSLIESIYQNPSHWNNLAEVLDYLGYRDEISTKFSFNISKSTLEEFLDKANSPEEFFHNTRTFTRSLNRRFFQNEYGEIDVLKFDILRSILNSILREDFEIRSNRLVYLNINHSGISIESSEIRLYSEQIVFLINSGILKLRDIGLVKKNRGSIFSIKDSSSGEQSVIISILGIASKITDNSIICIDEPEVCLHPEWQEKYIQILINTFRKFRRCHFIIATHSPQIISKLSPNNCFVISMEDAEINNANQYLNNSIDYQLANLFKTPGFKNEYLSRIAFTIFSKVGKNKRFDEDDFANYKVLKDVFKSLEENDPVKELISVITELYKKYA